MIAILMFSISLITIFSGIPVAFVFGGIGLLFGLSIFGPEEFFFMPFRIESIMSNTTLMAVPLFILMGMILQKTQMAERLLSSTAILFGSVRGGLAVATILVGALLAASTGVVGASVVSMGLISLPIMLKSNYKPTFACGTICASGTLGQIVPPSIILILLADVLGVPTGELFKAAIIPSSILISLYIIYILLVSWLNKETAPCVTGSDQKKNWKLYFQLIQLIIPPVALIFVVLGSIFAGIATPTESSAIGCVGAISLSILYRKFSWKILFQAAKETAQITGMVFMLLIGATAFALIFINSGGDHIVADILTNLPGEKWGFLFFSMLAIFILGFFIDFMEICFIVVPILAPIAMALNISPIWFAILIAMNLQTSFLTPPFGFSLFYLKGVSPKSIKTVQIYKGVLPFIAIQMCLLFTIVLFPEWYGLV